MLNMPKSFDDDNGVDWTLNLTSFKYWLFLVSSPLCPLMPQKLFNDLVATPFMKFFYKSFKVKLIQVAKLLTQPSPYFLHEQPLPN